MLTPVPGKRVAASLVRRGVLRQPGVPGRRYERPWGGSISSRSRDSRPGSTPRCGAPRPPAMAAGVRSWSDGADDRAGIEDAV